MPKPPKITGDKVIATQRSRHEIICWYQKKLPYQSYSIEKTILETNSNLEGLRLDEIATRLEEFGLNQLTKKDSTPAILVFLEQFNNPLVYILLAVSLVSLGLGKIVDAFVIFFQARLLLSLAF